MVQAEIDGVSKSEQAYRWISNQIAAREFGPGARLVLADIARDLEMSVVPVREAIRRLEAEGVVTFERNVGARVAIADEHEYVDTMQTLGALEGVATSLAAPLLTEADLDRAEKLNLHLELLLEDFDARLFTQFNRRFHEALFSRCPNPQILELVRRGWSQLAAIRDSTFAIVPGRSRTSVQEHQHILDLIRQHAEPLEIELAVRRHRWRTLDAYLASHRTSSTDHTKSDQR